MLVSTLPSEIILLILTFLDPKTLGRIASINRLLYVLSNKQVLWRPFVPFHPFLQKFAVGRHLRNWKSAYVTFFLRKFNVKKIAKPDKEFAQARRFLHRSTITSSGSMFIYGGHSLMPTLNPDLLKIDINNFTDIECTTIEAINCNVITTSTDERPMPRFAHGFTSQAMLVSTGKVERLFVFGGRNIEFIFNDLWEFNIQKQEWLQIHDSVNEVSNIVPHCRFGHVFEQITDELIVLFGGGFFATEFNDIWILDTRKVKPHVPLTEFWIQVPIEGELPMSRAGHAGTICGGYLYIFGGNNREETFNDFWRIDLKNICAAILNDCRSPLAPCQWERLSCVNGPEPMIGLSMCPIGPKLFLFGGRDVMKNNLFNSYLHLFNTETHQWERLLKKLPTLTGQAIFPHSTGIIIVGGLEPSNRINENVYLLNLTGQDDNEFKRIKDTRKAMTMIL